ncbi:MAG: DsbE family thiol:disulfide interchange protein [Legionellales bacterium]|nr:DsbE family thiol:disulfide interchange protein [Legionellales bacterium]
MLNRFVLFLPLFAVVISLSMIMNYALSKDPTQLASPLIDMPLPEFSEVDVLHPDQTITKESLLGQSYLVNVWASWCAECVREHQMWVELQKEHPFKLVGVLYSDKTAHVLPWLSSEGNPYTSLIDDPQGHTMISFGAYGTPETLLVDAHGFIIKRFLGPISRKDWSEIILPELDHVNSNH